MRSAPSLALAALACAFGLCGEASADEAFDVVQVICIPKAHYFYAERRPLWDISPRAVNSLGRLGDALLTWPERLEGKPIACSWDSHTIRLIAFSPTRASEEKPMPCATGAGERLQVSWDSTRTFCLNSPDGKADWRQSVTIVQNGLGKSNDIQAEECSVELKPSNPEAKILAEEGMLHCETKLFDPATGKSNI